MNLLLMLQLFLEAFMEYSAVELLRLHIEKEIM